MGERRWFLWEEESLGAKRTVATGDVLSSKISKRGEEGKRISRSQRQEKKKIVIHLTLFGLESGSASHVQGAFEI